MSDKNERPSRAPEVAYETKPLQQHQISINSQQPVASEYVAAPPPKPKPKG